MFPKQAPCAPKQTYPVTLCRAGRIQAVRQVMPVAALPRGQPFSDKPQAEVCSSCPHALVTGMCTAGKMEGTKPKDVTS